MLSLLCATAVYAFSQTADAADKDRDRSKYAVNNFAEDDKYTMLNPYETVTVQEPKGKKVKNIIFMFTDAKARKALDPSKLGLDIFLELACIITESIPKCEAELYGLLSMTSDLSVEQIKKQSPAVTFEMIVDFVKKEEFGDFFKVATKLFK